MPFKIIKEIHKVNTETVRITEKDIVGKYMPNKDNEYEQSYYKQLKGIIKTDKYDNKVLVVGEGEDYILKFVWGIKFHGDRGLLKRELDIVKYLVDVNRYLKAYKNTKAQQCN